MAIHLLLEEPREIFRKKRKKLGFFLQKTLFSNTSQKRNLNEIQLWNEADSSTASVFVRDT